MVQIDEHLFTQKATVIQQTLATAIARTKSSLDALLSLMTPLQSSPLVEDFRMIFERDPAACHWLEVLCCYPGFHALISYRFAHWLHRRNIPFFPRLISHLGRFFTGIEIHPGAVLGKGIVIDHGMGVTIGETAIVGDYALIYQEVTLGGTGKESGKRHPTIGDRVVIGAGAKILGNIRIGHSARIGAGSVVLRDVPNHCTAVGVPSRNYRASEPETTLDSIRNLTDRIENLERQLQTLTLSQSQNHANAS